MDRTSLYEMRHGHLLWSTSECDRRGQRRHRRSQLPDHLHARVLPEPASAGSVVTSLLNHGAQAAKKYNSGLPVYLDGEVRLFNFAEDGIDHDSLEWFFAIQGELMEEWSENERNGCADKGFIHNQSIILDAFVKGNLYGLCMPETRSMYDNVTPDDLHFMTSRFTGRCRYRFPVFCAVDNNRIVCMKIGASGAAPSSPTKSQKI
jgi:hypothetical protein